MSDPRHQVRLGARGRLHANFISQSSRQVAELTGLLADGGEDVVDMVDGQLERIQQTAGALGLNEVVAGVQETRTRIAKSPEMLALVPLARSLRPLIQSSFAPLGFVAEGALGESLRKLVPTTAEPLVVLDTIEACSDPLRLQPWSALVVPAADTTRAVALAEGAPVIAYGVGVGLQERVDAVSSGAVGFIPQPCPVSDMLFRIRRLSQVDVVRPEVFILAADTSLLQVWTQSFEALGWSVVVSKKPEEMALVLEQIGPDAIVLEDRHWEDGRFSTENLIRVTRVHANHCLVPLMVCTDRSVDEAYWDAGADEVVSTRESGRSIARRMEQRRIRAEKMKIGRSDSSGLVKRAEGLSQLDRCVRASQRTGQLLSCMLVEIQGLDHVRGRWGKAATMAAHRILGLGLDEGLRQTDLLVHLDQNTFLTLLPGCHQALARQRGEVLVARMRHMLHRDHRLQGLACRFGVADNERGPLWLAKRADEDLRMSGRLPA